MKQATHFFKSPFETLFDPSWREFFEKEYQESYFQKLLEFLASQEAASKQIYPPKDLIFNSFRQTPLDQVKVVIMGQDPYHGPGQAHGLSFSVSQGINPPPSLKNIFQEMKADLQISPPNHGCLLSWAHQGVLLLNATLTVEAGQPQSHQKQGWEIFTDHVIQKIASLNRPIVFILWGRFAQEKCLHLIDLELSKKFLILKAAHPSPFSAYNGFFGCQHFSKANDFLKKQGLEPINWSIC